VVERRAALVQEASCCQLGRNGSQAHLPESYRRDGLAAGDPFARPFSQAPAVAPARKVTTKLSIVNVSIMGKKRNGEKKVPA
jgi:hypothetical protein